jgi:hypothetical protein
MGTWATHWENYWEPWGTMVWTRWKDGGNIKHQKKSQTPTPRKNPSLPKSMLSLLLACMKFLLLKVFVTILGQGHGCELLYLLINYLCGTSQSFILFHVQWATLIDPSKTKPNWNFQHKSLHFQNIIIEVLPFGPSM